MNIYDKIRRMGGTETYDEKMYKLLNTERFNQERYETTDKGEDMSLVKQCILEWLKPRFLLDHRTRCAYEFMDAGEELVTITDEDIDWKSLDDLPPEAIERAKNHDGHFPTIIYGFNNGVAEVEWQLNPDGRYYMDDEGFGMTNDEEISLWGKIDRTGKVVEPFTYRKKN